MTQTRDALEASFRKGEKGASSSASSKTSADAIAKRKKNLMRWKLLQKQKAKPKSTEDSTGKKGDEKEAAAKEGTTNGVKEKESKRTKDREKSKKSRRRSRDSTERNGKSKAERPKKTESRRRRRDRRSRSSSPPTRERSRSSRKERKSRRGEAVATEGMESPEKAVSRPGSSEEADRAASDKEKDLSRSPPPKLTNEPVPPEMSYSCWDHYSMGCRVVSRVYAHCNQISEGVYGVVHRARCKETQTVVALKKIKYYKSVSGFPLTSLREIQLLLELSQFNHPNIVRVREVVTNSTGTDIYMAMEYAENDLQNLMQNRQVMFTLPQVKCLFKQLLTAVAFLQKKWIIHRDLKTSNLLLTKNGVLKVCDLGMARKFGSPVKPMTNLVVTLWYRAPELLFGAETYGSEVDDWSLGCILVELLTSRVLFPGKGEMNQINRIFKLLGSPSEEDWPEYSSLPHVQRHKFPKIVGSIDENFTIGRPILEGGPALTEKCLDLIKKLLTYNPANRITSEEALSHPFFEEAPLACDPSEIPEYQPQGHPVKENRPEAIQRKKQSPDEGAPAASAEA